jgi:Domain of Unknown Function with PDB structure (DUF3857)/Transglutaminase-like superfamily
LRSPKSLLFLVLATALLAARGLAARELTVRPAPAWVERAAVDTSVAVAKENVRWGIYDLLSDHQVRVTSASESHFYRTVRNVLSPSGVQNASELSLDFDPSFQRLTIHEVKVLRNGVAVSAFEPDEVRVIDKEDDTDSGIYDGEKTALVFIRDVRPGDVIDYSWSLDGTNSLLGGRYVDTYDLSSAVPTRRLRHRLVWPLGRPLNWRGGEPALAARGAEQIHEWERADVRALDIEDGIPSWHEPWESIQISEFASWAEVAKWADAMFVLDERSASAVKTLANTLKTLPTPEARATAAIRFVQDEIRYLGIEMGRNSHEPHQPWETLEQRWGDCKDKTLLLVALLRELGFEAYPALVNTRLRSRLTEKIASPFLFDHVIAQVVVAGREHWVDGTIADQGGTLTTLETPNFGVTLLVRADATALAKIAAQPKGAIQVAQTYTTNDYAEPTVLEVKRTYTGRKADAMRSYLASLSLDDYAKDRINDLAGDQPKIQAAGAPKIADDRTRNVIVVTERYRVPELWKEGEWTWYPRVLESHLTRPETMIRSMPLAFDFPLEITQSVTFHFPDDVGVAKSTSAIETDAFRYDYTVDGSGKTVWIKQSLRARKDAIAVADVPDHLTKLNMIWGEIGYRLTPDVPKTKPAAKASSGSKWGWGIAGVAGFVGLCSFLALRGRRRVLQPVAEMFRPGEAPMSAVPVRDPLEIRAHLSSRLCGCGAIIHAAGDMQRARYADREMTIVTRHCGVCGKEQSVYFTAA